MNNHETSGAMISFMKRTKTRLLLSDFPLPLPLHPQSIHPKSASGGRPDSAKTLVLLLVNNAAMSNCKESDGIRINRDENAMGMHSDAINISSRHHHSEVVNCIKCVRFLHIIYRSFYLIQYVKRIQAGDVIQKPLLENKPHLRLFCAVSSARLF